MFADGTNLFILDENIYLFQQRGNLKAKKCIYLI